MVCVRSQESASKISGGFVLVPVASLMTAWRACRARPLGIGDFRAWLACREMVARRSAIGVGRSPSYDFAELARLLGVTTRRARASTRRLVEAGLMEWSESAIAFPELNQCLGELPTGIPGRQPRDLGPIADSIGAGNGKSRHPPQDHPVPRGRRPPRTHCHHSGHAPTLPVPATRRISGQGSSQGLLGRNGLRRRPPQGQGGPPRARRPWVDHAGGDGSAGREPVGKGRIGSI